MLLGARQAQGLGDGHMSVVVSSGPGPNMASAHASLLVCSVDTLFMVVCP